MKFEAPNGMQVTVDPTAGVTVRVLPGGTMEIQGPRKAGGGKLAAGMMLSMVCAGAIGFITSDLVRDASNAERNATADRLARYDNTAVPRLRGAEPPDWVQRMPQYGVVPPVEVLPPQARAAVPTNEPQVVTPPTPAPAPAQPQSNAPQSPFGLDAP